MGVLQESILYPLPFTVDSILLGKSIKLSQGYYTFPITIIFMLKITYLKIFEDRLAFL